MDRKKKRKHALSGADTAARASDVANWKKANKDAGLPCPVSTMDPPERERPGR